MGYSCQIIERTRTKQHGDTAAEESSLEILVESNSVLVGVVQSGHDTALLVITNTLLEEVSLAPVSCQQQSAYKTLINACVLFQKASKQVLDTEYAWQQVLAMS